MFCTESYSMFSSHMDLQTIHDSGVIVTVVTLELCPWDLDTVEEELRPHA